MADLSRAHVTALTRWPQRSHHHLVPWGRWSTHSRRGASHPLRRRAAPPVPGRPPRASSGRCSARWRSVWRGSSCTRRPPTSRPRSTAPACGGARASRSGTRSGTAGITSRATRCSSGRSQRCSGRGRSGSSPGVVAVAALTVIARRQERFPRLVGWLFAAGVMTNVLIGRVPFVLGIALGALAWLCADAQRRRPAMLALAALLALATVWASPPAGLFLALAGAARRLSGERRDTAAAIALAVPPIVGGLAVAIAFPEGGRDHFAASAFWPTFALGLAGLALLDPRRRALRLGVLAALVLLVAAFVVPTSVGQTALRPLVILGPALLALGLRPGGRKVARRGRGRRRRPVVPAVAARRPRDRRSRRAIPSTKRSYYSEVLRIVDREREPGERLEIPLTRNHWEAAVVAPADPAGARLAPPARRGGQPPLLRPPPADRDALRGVALRPRRALGRAAERAPGLLGPARGRPAALRRRARPAPRPAQRQLDDLGGPARPAAGDRPGDASRARAPTPSSSPCASRPHPGARDVHPLLDDRARRRLHRARPRRADGGGRARAGTLRVEARLSVAGALGRARSCTVPVPAVPAPAPRAAVVERAPAPDCPSRADGGRRRPRVLSSSRHACIESAIAAGPVRISARRQPPAPPATA